MLILVRHGRTVDNAAGLLLGHADPPLDAEGERQAAALARAIGDAARVVTSPLGRARATAAAIGGPLTVDERWIELDYGELDRRPVADVPPEVWRAWRADDNWAPPGGESLAALGRRVRAACEDLVAEAAEHDVVVVSHVSPIKAAVAWALGTDDRLAWRLRLDTASITRVTIGPTGPVLCSFNEIAHLG